MSANIKEYKNYFFKSFIINLVQYHFLCVAHAFVPFFAAYQFSIEPFSHVSNQKNFRMKVFFSHSMRDHDRGNYGMESHPIFLIFSVCSEFRFDEFLFSVLPIREILGSRLAVLPKFCKIFVTFHNFTKLFLKNAYHSQYELKKIWLKNFAFNLTLQTYRALNIQTRLFRSL